ncbi:SDR family NAD(P)-dependent oxidoreductase [Mesorhizobium sp. BAC0120]|uniref:SDR family NAD(P)-dependent oxidoreductase n=1 Tax=Mesorhizobium sp. BAC0120 TaxID=3090670 RepID=UPI00298BD666|nr:SDR family NAD(P)-dependent oxidoreductase [Mesorhizobium sp. BAC0120]MDW6021842.1 SDR family NAD(P)-dependent oxidoreductase [Mesorhizobium sp. BAC0120]
MFRLDGKRVFITGGGGGIGRAAALMFAAFGAHVVVLDLDSAAAEGVRCEVAELGGAASAFALDVSDEASVLSVFSQAEREAGGLDVLVNNAGISICRPSTELSLEDWNRVVSVNLTGMFLCSRTAARSWIGRGVPGAVINTASIMSYSGGGLHPNISYQSTKAGVVNLTRTLAVEWADNDIRVNAVAPTWVRTPLIDHLMADEGQMEKIRNLTPLKRLAEPEEVAAAMIFLAGRASAMTTGHVLAVDGGYLAR